LLLTVLLLDLWTKYAAFNWLRRHGSVPIIDGFLRLVMAENTGAAFGIAAGHRWLLVTASVAALLVIFMVFLLSGKEPTLIHIALGIFAGGVCGNLYDRLFNEGRVRDFIDVVYWPGRHWPAFNLADSVLCISVALLILAALRQPRHDA
jgi:signal peptidase II